MYYQKSKWTFIGSDGEFCSNWWSKIPQGFSCGKGVSGPDYFDEFVPVDCFEIIVKVVKAESCYNNPDLGEDCFNFVNWTWFYRCFM